MAQGMFNVSLKNTNYLQGLAQTVSNQYANFTHSLRRIVSSVLAQAVVIRVLILLVPLAMEGH
jgi:hypothetical protein